MKKIRKKFIAVVLSFALGANGVAFAKGKDEVVVGNEDQVISNVLSDYQRVVPLQSREQKEKEKIVTIANFRGKGSLKSSVGFNRSRHFDGSGGNLEGEGAILERLFVRLDKLFSNELSKFNSRLQNYLGPDSIKFVDAIVRGGFIPSNFHVSGTITGSSCLLGHDFPENNHNLALNRAKEHKKIIVNAIQQYLEERFGIVMDAGEIGANISIQGRVITRHPLVAEAVRIINKKHFSGLNYQKIAAGNPEEIRIFNERMRWLEAHDNGLYWRIVEMLAPLRQSQTLSVVINLRGEVQGMIIMVDLLKTPLSKQLDHQQRVALLKQHQTEAWRLMEKFKSKDKPMRKGLRRKGLAQTKNVPRSSKGYRNKGVRQGRVKL